MSEQEQMDSRLWDFIDRTGSTADMETVAALIRTAPAWQERHTLLMEQHRQLQQLLPAQPSLRFSKNIMEQIAELPTPALARNYINKWVVRGIVAVFVLLIGGVLLYGFSAISWFSSNTGNDAFTMKLPNMPKLPDTSVLQTMIVATILLALVLADKVISLKRTRHF